MNAEEVGEFTAVMEKAEKQFVALQLQTTPHVAQLLSFVHDIQPLFDSLPSSSSSDESPINHPKFSRGTYSFSLYLYHTLIIKNVMCRGGRGDTETVQPALEGRNSRVEC